MAKRLLGAMLTAMLLITMGCTNVSSYDTDKTALSAAIQDATALLNGTPVGTSVGNVSQRQNSLYATAIANAQKVSGNVLASKADVDSALLTLAGATAAFNAAIVKAGSGDKTALDTAIADATALCDKTAVGTAVGNVSQADKDAYSAAIASAQAASGNASATQAEIAAAVTALAAATTAFNAAIVTASPVDKTALAKAITDANALVNATAVGTAVGNVSQANKDAYSAAIASAQAVNGNASATQADIDAAVTALGGATAAFEDAILVSIPDSVTFPYGYVFDCQRRAYPSTNQFLASSLKAPYDSTSRTQLAEFATDTGAYLVLAITTAADGDTISTIGLDLYTKDGSLSKHVATTGSISYLGHDGFIYVSTDTSPSMGYFFSRSKHAYTKNVTYSYTVETIAMKSQLVW